jgi:hypothetical protein
MGTEYFMPLSTSIVLTEDYNVMVKREELIGATEYLNSVSTNEHPDEYGRRL